VSHCIKVGDADCHLCILISVCFNQSFIISIMYLPFMFVSSVSGSWWLFLDALLSWRTENNVSGNYCSI